MKTGVRPHALRRRETHVMKTGVRRPAFRGPSSTQDRTRVFGPSPSFGWSLKTLKRLHYRSVATPDAPAMLRRCSESRGVYDPLFRKARPRLVNTKNFEPFRNREKLHAYA